jgi:hypothetical protein
MRPSLSMLAPAVAAALVGVSACGGAASSELFAPPDSPDAGEQRDTSVSPRDSALPPPPIDSGTIIVDSSVKDTNLPDTTVPVDTSPPPPGIGCGDGLTCDSQQYCCATIDPNMINPTTYACKNGSTSDCTNSGGSPVTCDTETDCPVANPICCGTENTAMDQYSHVRCATTCATMEDRTFCDPNANPDICQAMGMMCGPSTLLPGFSVCQ